MTPRKITVPGPEVPLMMSDRTMNPDWYPVFKFLETLQPLSDIDNPSFGVSTIAVGNTTTSITNRTVSDVGNGSLVGTDTSVLGVGTVSNPQQNGWTTLMNVTNSFSANHTAHKNAADGLNTRTTALENKVNAVINRLVAMFP